MDKLRVGAGFGVFLFKNGKVLLGKRHEDAEKADSKLHGEGTWTMPGGKLEFGESFEEGGKREVMEETGINLKSLRVICVNNDKVSDAHFVTIGMFAEAGKDFLFEAEAKVMEPDEITEWRWFDLNDLPEKMFFPSRKVLNCYLKKEVYLK